MQTSDPFKFFFDNLSLFGDKTVAHMELSLAAIGVAILVAIPLGVWLGHIHRGSFVAINTGNIGRALPSLAVLAIGDAFLGLGLPVVVLALVILAVPPIITNAYLGVDGVDRDLVDAARGMGMSEGEILRRVELPLAVPLIFAGIRTAAVFVISTTTIASLAGFSGTLGDPIANETSYHFSGVLGAAICVAALALVVEGLLTLLQRGLTPRGVRVERDVEIGMGAPAPGLT
jgi:osmoprotectant transport system permease protein